MGRKSMQKQAEGVMHRKRLKRTRVDTGGVLSTHTLPGCRDQGGMWTEAP